MNRKPHYLIGFDDQMEFKGIMQIPERLEDSNKTQEQIGREWLSEFLTRWREVFGEDQ